jgi:two-component system, OmpR family, sensor histidine kinase CiaH
MTFHRSSLKLAGLYLTIIMTISLFFSVSLYNVSMEELGRGLRGPGPRSVIEAMPGYGSNLRMLLEEERENQFEQARERVTQKLVVINLLILIGAGFLSYYLAYRTLKPIEEAHEAQARFTADASHELRTPIAAMQTETEVALMDPKLTLVDAKQQLTSNLEELAKLTNLTESLLGLAQYEGDTRPDMESVALGSVLKSATEKIQPLADQKRITIQIPQAVEERVRANEQLLAEVLVIVLDNAVKYSDKKSAIVVVVRQEHKQILIDITDHGQGIRATDLPHIFDRFYRADTARNKQHVDGYGLGLPLAKRIMALQGGDISAVSKVGEGSTFTISIPVA